MSEAIHSLTWAEAAFFAFLLVLLVGIVGFLLRTLWKGLTDRVAALEKDQKASAEQGGVLLVIQNELAHMRSSIDQLREDFRACSSCER